MKNKLFQHIYACYLLWKMGFFFSTSVTNSEWKDVKRKGGFLRLNHKNPETEKVYYALADLDFSFENGELLFVSMKADNENLAKTTFRYDAKNK